MRKLLITLCLLAGFQPAFGQYIFRSPTQFQKPATFSDTLFANGVLLVKSGANGQTDTARVVILGGVNDTVRISNSRVSADSWIFICPMQPSVGTFYATNMTAGAFTIKSSQDESLSGGIKVVYYITKF